jgi:hypothetical protein
VIRCIAVVDPVCSLVGDENNKEKLLSNCLCKSEDKISSIQKIELIVSDFAKINVLARYRTESLSFYDETILPTPKSSYYEQLHMVFIEL